MSKKQEVKTPPDNVKMGLGRFLDEKPQTSGVRAVLRSKHRMEVHTIIEWQAIIKQDMQTKIRG